jgi:hypothetical protein
MNPNEQRIAIACACGKGRAIAAAELSHRSIDEYDIPNYPPDLNAMHEAEKGLTKHQRFLYINALGVIVCGNDHQPPTWLMITATAVQRAEAFLRTLNLWKE